MEPLLYQCSDPPGRQSLEPCRQIPPGEWLFPSGVHRRTEAHERIEIGTASLRRISDGPYISRNNLQIAYRSGIGYNKICFIIYLVLSEEESMPHANIIYVTNLQLPGTGVVFQIFRKPVASLF